MSPATPRTGTLVAGDAPHGSMQQDTGRNRSLLTPPGRTWPSTIIALFFCVHHCIVSPATDSRPFRRFPPVGSLPFPAKSGYPAHVCDSCEHPRLVLPWSKEVSLHCLGGSWYCMV